LEDFNPWGKEFNIGNVSEISEKKRAKSVRKSPVSKRLIERRLSLRISREIGVKLVQKRFSGS
jgi:hypothetical protein